MHKIILVGVIFLTITNVNAQNLGFKAGGVYSYYEDPPDAPNGTLSKSYYPVSSRSNIGFQLGAYLQFNMGKRFIFQPELTFITKGSKNYPTSYLEIPVLFKYKIFKELAFGLGPGFAFQITGYPGDNQFDLGLNIDLSYNFIKHIEVGFRFNKGFLGVSSFSYVDINGASLGNYSVSNTAFILYVGYKFSLKPLK